MMRWLLAATLPTLLWACGDGSLRAEGEECAASSQCAAGLVCNMGVDPHVCAGMGVPPPPPDIDAVPDPADADPNAPDADPTQPDAPAPPDGGSPDADTDAA